MNKRYDITPILYVGDQFANLEQKIETLTTHFDTVWVMMPDGLPVPHINDAYLDTYTKHEHKVDILNKVIQQVNSKWILYLEADEDILLRQLDKVAFNENEMYACLIECVGADSKKYYQVRLFQNTDNHVFEGIHIPDISKYANMNGWTLSEMVLPIQKTSDLYSIDTLETEIELGAVTYTSLFWEASLLSAAGHYAKAEQLFKRVLKKNELITYKRLATLNGLADALMEQHKWAEAEVVALESLAETYVQRAPYLILFKVNYMNGRWEQAYKALEGYLATLDFESRATMDVFFPVVECHFLMAEAKSRLGEFETAFYHYEQFYHLNNGEVTNSVLERLFIYSIELNDYEKSVFYFNEMFGEEINEQAAEDMPIKMLESLSLFNKKGWYDFVGSVYEQLRNYDPTNKKLLHSWVATLVKANKLEEAQSLIGFMKKKKPA